jgi:formylglycine-generating enzyme required for sulfatase activity
MDLIRHNRWGMEFRLIQPGHFSMGSPASERGRRAHEQLHAVTLTRAYYLQTTLLTQSQWRQVMSAQPARFQAPEHPVEQVSWDDCQALIQRLNQGGEGRYRLPSEAEWEYACRAGTHTPFALERGLTLSPLQAQFKAADGPPVTQTCAVKSFPPNAWGLYEMHGNVWEWCQDWYAEYPEHGVIDPEGPATGHLRVIRGGSWLNVAESCRSATRAGASAGDKYYALGLRLIWQP